MIEPTRRRATDRASTEEPIEIGNLGVELERYTLKDVLRLVGNLVDPRDDSLDRVGTDLAPGDSEWTFAKEVPQHDDIRGQLDAMVGAIFSTRLPLDDPQARRIEIPEHDEEIDPAAHLEAADRRGDLDLPTKRGLPRLEGLEACSTLGPGLPAGFGGRLADPAQILKPTLA